MRLVLLFFLLALTNLLIADRSPKIIVVWGILDSPNTPEEYSGSWEECIDQCVAEYDCVAIRQIDDDGCQVYRYNNISTVSKSDKLFGYRVGFKITLDICPVSAEAVFLDGPVTETRKTERVAHRYSVHQTSTGWEVSFKFYIQCQADSLASVRGDHPVCLSGRLFPESVKYCGNRAFAERTCREDGGIGLTAFDDVVEEQPWTYNLSQRIFAIEYCKPYFSNYYIWLDGVVKEGSFVLTDPTLSGKISSFYGSNCENLFLRYDLMYGYVKCGKSTETRACGSYNDYCYRGAMCRTEPLLSI